ncbi:MAG: hypothetical protein ACPGTP_07885, partial [Bacteroidia bacterium]
MRSTHHLKPMPKKAKRVDYAAIARRRKSQQSKVNRRPQDDIEQAMRSGALVQEGIDAIKQYGKTEFGQKLRWSNWFEELMRLVLDLRIAEVFTSGGAQISKTFANALAASFFAQYVGIRVGWCFPLDKLLDLHVPTQHKPLLEQWSKQAGAVQSKSSSTSNRLYDLGVGRSIFTSISSNKTGGAAAGTNIVSFTADVAFLEEASQCSWSDMAPIKSRVEQSISPVYPLRYLGTPGGGTGIELQAQDAEYEFWPHCQCIHCGEEINLDPRDTLLIKNYFRLPNGQLEARYLTTTGLPIEWHQDQDGTAMFACPHCGEEVDDYARQNDSYFRCVKTGVSLMEFVNDIVPEKWETKRFSASLWLSPLLRHKPGKVVAQNIIDNGLNPDSASDWCEQQLGIPSTAMATSITNEHLLAALKTTPFQGGEKVRIMGIDQGRDRWWCTLFEVWWEYEGTHMHIFNNARFNFLDAKGVPWTEAGELADPIARDIISKTDVEADLAELVRGDHPGRR